MILNSLFKKKDNRASRLYGAIVAAARQPKFYRELGVADTIDGRFELLALHLSLVLERLKGEDHGLRQALVDRFTADMDDNVRELGAGDLGVSKKVRHMAEALEGRYRAYEKALDLTQMKDAMARNIYEGKTPAPGLAQYALDLRATLAARTLHDLIQKGPQLS